MHKVNSDTNFIEIYKGMAGICMRETSIMDNLICNMQALVRVCKENNEELDKMSAS